MKQPFLYPEQLITDTINGIPDEVKKEYPGHILDPVRIEIARELALKEYYKLFPLLQESDFASMGDTMVEWVDGRKSEMAPIHDYWNFLGGTLMSLKLKNIRSYLTSENITWAQESIDPKNLQLYWPVGTLSRHENNGSGYTYDFVKEKIIDQPDEFAENIDISNAKSGDTKVDRDQYPIIVLRQLDGSLQLMDGNRRVMRAWLKNEDAINAWVGTVNKKPLLLNQWVGTDFLRLLVSEYMDDPSDEVFESVRSQLKILFSQSTIAKLHYKKRCLNIKGAKELAEGIL